MSFQRRWFLTAAGSAFLASIAGVIEAGQQRALSDLTGDPVEDLKILMKSFEQGHGGLAPADYTLCSGFLGKTYKTRYVLQYKSLDPAQKAHLEGFAYALGHLTRLSLDREKAGTCGWPKNEKATLREEHLDRARELLGFHLNGCFPGGKRCSGTAPIKTKETDQPCPLCSP